VVRESEAMRGVREVMERADRVKREREMMRRRL
jgi:hypothetical protein